MFYTILENNCAEITEKKSKFICNVFHIESVQEAENIIAQTRKKYHDARHNCYAYRIADGDLYKSSDDGEPSGTAGVPILNILNGKNLSNVLVIVTRYFGGILLGTGGLVRAYSLATTEAIDSSKLTLMEVGLQACFDIEYKDLNEVKYHLSNIGVEVVGLVYEGKIKVTIEGEEGKILKIEENGLSERVCIEDFKVLGKKYVRVPENR